VVEREEREREKERVRQVDRKVKRTKKILKVYTRKM
jgi:hypothetical protein